MTMNEVDHNTAIAFNRALGYEMRQEHFEKKGEKIEKAWPPAGKGWEPVPHGHKGGFRRKAKGGDGYEYVYPDKQIVPRVGVPKSKPQPAGLKLADEQALAQEWEQDPARTYKQVKPNEVVKIRGLRGLYRVVADKRISGQNMRVRSLASGDTKLVTATSIYPLRAVKKQAPPKVKPKAKQEAKPKVAPKPERTNVGPKQPAIGDRIRKLVDFKDSRAKKGTALYDLEHGVFPVKKYGGHGNDSDRKWRYGAYVPVDRQAQFLEEVAPLLHGAASQVARRFHIKKHVRGNRTAAYDELLAGAAHGLTMALTRYKGGTPFLPMAQQYALMYALRQARTELGAGTRVSDRAQRVLGRYVASKHYARYRRNNYEPTFEDIAPHWSVRKKDVYGTHSKIGLRPTDHGMVEQGEEELPIEDWQVMNTKGEPVGKPRPGKRRLAEIMEGLMRGDRIGDTDWMVQHPGNLPEVPHGSTLAESTVYAFKDQVRSVLEAMPKKDSTALAMHFGIDREKPASVPEIATAIGVGKGFADSHKYKLMREGRVLEQALATFKRIAVAKDLAVAHHLDKYAIEHGPSPIAHVEGPTYSELRSQFKNDERVQVYLTAKKHGQGPRAERILDDEASGNGREVDSEALRSDYMKWRDEDRVKAFVEATKTIAVPPEAAHDVGPQTGTPSEAKALYPDEVWTDYLVAVGKVGRAHAAFPVRNEDGRVSWTTREIVEPKKEG